MKKKDSISVATSRDGTRSISQSIESIASLNQICLIDTEKAWKELEMTGDLIEPELRTLRPLDLYDYDTQSIQSIPDHNIPYQVDDSDTIVCSILYFSKRLLINQSHAFLILDIK